MFNRILYRHKSLLRGMAAYCVLYPSANLTQQYLRSGRRLRVEDLDLAEAARFLVYGGLCHAPLVHRWLHVANKWFPGTSFQAIGKKVLLDQLLFAPVALSSFYVGLSILEGKDAEGVFREWRYKFPGTWGTAAFVWPFLQGFNFRFVPARYRVVFVGCASFFWTTMLAYWKGSEIDQR